MTLAVVLPGDRIRLPSDSNIRLGPGLAVPEMQDEGEKDQELIVTLPGFLGQVKNEKSKGRSTIKATEQMQVDGKHQQHSQSQGQTALWVESNSVRYIPSLNDPVVCQITNRGTESYQVSLFNSYTPATLSAFSFEGATKRNKPNLKVGTLLYAQVISAHRHSEVELSCVDQSTGKSNGYGELKTEANTTYGGGAANKTSSESTAMVWKVSCGLARSLLKPTHPLLVRLASSFSFEVAVGVNGFVWVRAGNPRHVIAVGKVLERADEVRGSEQEGKRDDTSKAVQVTRQRGVLSLQEINRIVEPFKS